jgi:methylphosphotriester-DNA--protein-cysteine methyltransferase
MATKKTATRTSSTTGESDFGPFIASNSKFHFHRPDCKWMQNVPDAKRIEFGTHKEAVESGRKPCKTCRA